MKALLFNIPGKIEVLEMNAPKILSNELLIQIEGCGVCGTDFHIFKGEAPSSRPVVLGHEFAGTVVESGNNQRFKAGDRVAVDPNIYCGYCEYCRNGRINFCSNLKALGVTLDGGMSQYTRIPSSQAYILPTDFNFSKAIFTEPVSCCLHGIDQASIKPGDTVAVIGAGTIGLIMVQLAKLSGALKVIALEPLQTKRKLSSQLGAEFTFDNTSPDFKNDFKEYFPDGVDVVIECAGKSVAVKTALDIVKKGGTVVVFGLTSRTDYLQLYLQDFFHKEINLKSSLLNPFTFQRAVNLIVSGKLNLELFKPSSIGLDETKIINMFTLPVNETVIKYMITPNN